MRMKKILVFIQENELELCFNMNKSQKQYVQSHRNIPTV